MGCRGCEAGLGIFAQLGLPGEQGRYGKASKGDTDCTHAYLVELLADRRRFRRTRACVTARFALRTAARRRTSHETHILRSSHETHILSTNSTHYYRWDGGDGCHLRPLGSCGG